MSSVILPKQNAYIQSLQNPGQLLHMSEIKMSHFIAPNPGTRKTR